MLTGPRHPSSHPVSLGGLEASRRKRVWGGHLCVEPDVCAGFGRRATEPGRTSGQKCPLLTAPSTGRGGKKSPLLKAAGYLLIINTKNLGRFAGVRWRVELKLDSIAVSEATGTDDKVIDARLEPCFEPRRRFFFI